MNRERAKELLPIIQAYAEGRDVQIREGCFPKRDWVDVLGEPDFSNPRIEYRIKPEPKTGWINIYSAELDGGAMDAGYIFKTKWEADQYCARNRIACIQITYTEGEGL
jgi:hypothetical protein